MTNQNVAGFIFDYGGTIDTRGCHWGMKIWQAYQKVGVPVDETDYRDAYVHAERTLGRNRIILPSYTFRETLHTKLRIQLQFLADRGCLPPDAADTWTGRLLDSLYDEVCHIVAESREVLVSLARRYPMVLVSNFYGNIEVVLREFHLDGLFQSVVESAVVGVRKPDPAIFALGVDALKLPAGQVVVVGDSYDKDIVPASAVGCQTVWVKGEGWTADPAVTDRADAVVGSLTQLLSLYPEVV